jgi:helicase MOV-10
MHHFQLTNYSSSQIRGKVVDIRGISVYLELDSNIKTERLYDVEFLPNRVQFRRMHHAVNQPSHLGITSFEFNPIENEQKNGSLVTHERIVNFEWTPFDQSLKSNPEQSRAVSIVCQDLFDNLPLVIFGPPGTGKTTTIVECIKQVHSINKDARILVCAPSNSAADVLLEKLARAISKKDMLRLKSVSLPVDRNTKDYCCLRFDGGKYDIPTGREFHQFKIIVSTCMSSSQIDKAGVPDGFFTHVFIDEVGQGIEPEVMIPINIFNHSPTTRFIMAGDHKQLGPIVQSRIAEQLGLGVSLIERLMGSIDESTCPFEILKMHNSNGKRTEIHEFSVKLLRNYRSHESILNIPNQLFYKSELQVFADKGVSDKLLKWDGLNNDQHPLLFIHLKGEEKRYSHESSFYNRAESEVVRKVVDDLLSFGVTEDQIGVITPYSSQSLNLQEDITGVEIGTVERFQGKERKVIIISTVRSNEDSILGFLGNPKRFNVAVTRAKALLIVVGNGVTLAADTHWKAWVRDCAEKDCIRGLDDELTKLLFAKEESETELSDMESNDDGENIWMDWV